MADMTLIDCPWVFGEWEPLGTVELSKTDVDDTLDRMRAALGRPTAAEEEQSREARELAHEWDSKREIVVISDDGSTTTLAENDSAPWPD